MFCSFIHVLFTQLEREEENLRNKSSAFTPMIDSLLRENPEVNSDKRESWEEDEEEVHNDVGIDQGETTYSQKPEPEDEQIRSSDAYKVGKGFEPLQTPWEPICVLSTELLKQVHEKKLCPKEQKKPAFFFFLLNLCV